MICCVNGATEGQEKETQEENKTSSEKANFETVLHADRVKQSYNENIIPVEISEIRKKKGKI